MIHSGNVSLITILPFPKGYKQNTLFSFMKGMFKKLEQETKAQGVLTSM